jgi:hypothetical protein
MVQGEIKKADPAMLSQADAAAIRELIFGDANEKFNNG